MQRCIRNSRSGLLAVLVIGLIVRVVGIRFGLPLHLHPDEWSQVDVALAMLRQGDPNPHFFRYSSLFMYQLATVDSVLQVLVAMFGTMLTSSAYYLAGRLLSAFYGVLTIWAVFLLGREIFDEQVGLLAAFLMAIAPEHVRQSHFAIVDVAMVFWVTLSLLLILQAVRKDSHSAFGVAGIAAGLAVGTKYTAAVLVFPLVGITVWYVWKRSPRKKPAWLTGHRAAASLILLGALVGAVCLVPVDMVLNILRQWTTDGVIEPQYLALLNAVLFLGRLSSAATLAVGALAWWNQDMRRAIGRVLGVLLDPRTASLVIGVIGAFIVSSPFVLLDFANAAPDIFYEYRHMTLGPAATLHPADPMYAELLPKNTFPQPLFYWNWWISQQGWPMTFALITGIWALARSRRFALGVTLTFTIMALFTLTRSANKADRYALLLLPVFMLWAGSGIRYVAGSPFFQKRRLASILLSVGVALLPVYFTWSVLSQQFLTPDTRVLAWLWINENVPSGSILLLEDKTPDLENVTEAYETIRVVSAFTERTVVDWQRQGVQYLVIGPMRDWYTTQAELYPQIAEQYGQLDEVGRIVATFHAQPGFSQGPTILVYRLP